MDYKKIAAKKSLLHSIEAYCFYKTKDPAIISDSFFPNGRPAIVFHLHHPFSFLNLDDNWELMPTISFINFITTPVSLHSGGNTDTIAIILNPYSVYNIYDVILKNTSFPIDASPNIQQDVYLQLKQHDSIEKRVKILDNYFTEKLKNYNPKKDLFKSICDCIIQNKGMIDRRCIAEDYGFSENYIHKLFMQRIGISFKPYAQIIRISNILQEIYYNNNKDWFEILEKYGYFDQAHFIKDFKKITGKTPLEYYRLDKTFLAIFSAMR